MDICSKKPSEVSMKQTLHGLYNQGATCYLNSILQILFRTTEIHDRLCTKPEQIDNELRKIFNLLREETCGTEAITKILEITNVHEQRDAAECLEMILCKISSPVSEVFQGELTYTTKCSNGHSINEETNPFWTLPLSLRNTHDKTYNVGNSYTCFFEPKSFSGDNMVYCNKCNEKTEAKSVCNMRKFPQILTLLLKRFDFDYDKMSHFKSDCCVDVPIKLPQLENQNNNYELYGIVNHMGSLRGGHYTATILSNDSWLKDNHLQKAISMSMFDISH
ncbi:ubiquitin carboxyl-terminal hydrolase 40-like [Etheostoma spectabile]|uniref:ubiquitin carboxyl-terminal hydrolase 40-like n=1 Tax=Etheostoma spectabile TaxID=54343 RepID=UPI0013AECD0A|nr:ubiquitin carboxyl-terminal hydrolase 40-like [Etheostoma spectabile]